MRDGRAAPPRRGELGQRVERRARAAEMIDQVAEGARADIVAADQPQPVEPLLVGELTPSAQRRPLTAASIAGAIATAIGRVSAVSAAPILPSVPLQQPRDIGAVHEPQQHGEHEKQHRGGAAGR